MDNIVGGILQTFVAWVFSIITTLVDLVMTPFINGIIALFPATQVYFQSVVDFFQVAFTYVTCVYRWFLFTPQMFILLFTYFFAKYGLWVAGNVARVGIRFYRWFKP